MKQSKVRWSKREWTSCGSCSIFFFSLTKKTRTFVPVHPLLPVICQDHDHLLHLLTTTFSYVHMYTPSFLPFPSPPLSFFDCRSCHSLYPPHFAFAFFFVCLASLLFLLLPLLFHSRKLKCIRTPCCIGKVGLFCTGFTTWSSTGVKRKARISNAKPYCNCM